MTYIIYHIGSFFTDSFFVCDPVKKSNKFISAYPAKNIVIACRGRSQSISHHFKNIIACNMTVFVVDRFEIIHVDHKYGSDMARLDQFVDRILAE
ncbi:MAG: hypothetical protein BWY61_00610 [Firmicutes bacterium ADurb.Bin354]|nr:MAG: hypothetical protein BWY61_00610 [Firmicutes bacterium ADurb.Bin354]